MKNDLKVPASKEEVRSPERETVDAAPNKGNVIEAQPVVDAGPDACTGHWEGNGPDIKYVK